MKTKKRHLIIGLICSIFCLLGWQNELRAQDEYEPRALSDLEVSALDEWSYQTSGEYKLVSGKTYTINSTITTGTDGLKLHLEGTGAATIKRGASFTGYMFSVADGKALYIYGNSTTRKYVVLDSGATFNTNYDARTKVTKQGPHGRIVKANGSLQFDWVILQNVFMTSDDGKGGAIVCSHTTTTNRNLRLYNTIIRGIRASRGAAIYYEDDARNYGDLRNCEIWGCYSTDSPGFTISTSGNTRADMQIINGSKIHDNKAARGAGIAWLSMGTLTIDGDSEFYNNEATDFGGGILVASSSDVDLKSVKVYNNKAPSGGGIYVRQYGGGASDFNGRGFNVELKNGLRVYNNTATIIGGGVYISVEGNADIGFNANGDPVNANFKLDIQDGCLIYGNHAPKGGGLAIYDNAPYQYYNTSLKKWSGVYSRHFKISGGTIRNNDINVAGTTPIGGAGIYVEKAKKSYNTQTDSRKNFGTLNLKIRGGQVYQNDAAGGNGGGFYISNFIEEGYTSNCNVTVENTVEVFGNNCTNDGAGIYINGSTFTMTNGTIGKTGTTLVEGSDPEEYRTNKNVAGQEGGGVYVDAGVVTINGGDISYNESTGDGGGVYVNPGDGFTTTIHQSTVDTALVISSNRAHDGGGLYASSGMVDFDSGIISDNYASHSGGGLYIPLSGTLTMKGTASLTGNQVPTSHHGGGIYLAGVVELGDASKTASTITIEDNYADDVTGATVDASNRNNIYLPDPIVSETAPHTGVLTVVEGGLSSSSRIGFSVPHNFVPVVYCESSETSSDYLDSFLAGGAMEDVIFHDGESYSINHKTEYPFDINHLYLSGLTWVQNITEAPLTGWAVSYKNVTIGSAEGLAWLASYVNNLNGVTGDHQDVKVTLTADVDMSEYSWVPIAFTGKTFTGTFDGQGHSISGLNCIFLGESGETKTGIDLGLFGNVGGNASISNVNLKNAYYSSMDATDKAFAIGGLAGNLSNTSGTPTLHNSVVELDVESASPDAVIGGLVGNNSGTIHSSFAAPKMTGFQMGGLVGSNTGSLYNSFANAKFTNSGSGYMGGLVGVNGSTGEVSNCYMRLQGTAPASNFGWLVGDNSGDVSYCYAPTGATPYQAHGDAPTNHGTYGETVTPYLYKHRDNQITLASGETSTYVNTTDAGADNQLLKVLNEWVAEENGESSTYTKWLRPTTKVINDDLPLLRLPATNAVAANNTAAELDYNQVNDLLSSYTAEDDAICLYGRESSMNGNASSSAKLYIDQEAVLKQSGTGGALNAYVGVALENRKVDNYQWHMFSTSLQNVPLGIDYDGNTTPYGFSWVHPEGMPYWRFYDDASNHGYFPSMDYTWAAANDFVYSPDNSAAADNGNYYYDWDYYCYSEPDYHWINFKRNSASHWHEDDEGATNIPYTNETYLGVGKGYFLSVKDDTYLQAYGTLNNGSLASNANLYKVTVTDGISYTNRQGFNLVGNPYQSYLDFDAFAASNSGLWDDDPTKAYYYIIDGDAYTKYVYSASSNPMTAPRLIHPHQGFFIVADNAAEEGTALVFNDDMRDVTGTNVAFRDARQPAYPLVNLIATDDEGKRDIATVELNRPDKGGAKVMDNMRVGKGIVYCHYEDEDYAIAFTQPGISEVGIRFETTEDAPFTMTWDTENGEFHYLHLIDNMTGTDIDCLTAEEYKFTSKTTDYKSRFRLVFDYTGIDEPETDEPAEGLTAFAFQMGNELVVNGEGYLEVIDVMGRIVRTEQLQGSQSMVSLPMTAGVYVLRLTGRDGVRTQKMVVR